MNMQLSQDRPISIAIMALGGQGGGVMMDWLVQLAESQGWVAQSTSVPGVAQRTGATVYYVEMIKKSERTPILSLMPTPGMVDMVVAAEWMETGRAIQRGFVTPDRTCLVASTHRLFSVTEKSEPGDGTLDPEVVRKAAEAASKSLFAADMAAIAENAGSVISSSLFGAIAASGALPFPREAFEEAIRNGGVGVAASLRAFAAGFDAIADPKPAVVAAKPAAVRLDGGSESERQAYQQLQARMESELPQQAREMAQIGLARVIDFQDSGYGADYLARLLRIHEADRNTSGNAKDFAATQEAAKYLAAAMAYSDVIRVADLKTRPARFQRIRNDINAPDDQIVAMTEFLHPRVEEMASLLPERMGKKAQSSKLWSSLIGLFAGGKRIRTDSLRGFLMLYVLAGLRHRRLGSLRHANERRHIDEWMSKILSMLPQNYDLAVQIIRSRRLIKGYSDTHARGLGKYDKVMQAIDQLKGRADGAEWADRLIRLALKDAEGKELDGALATIASFETESA